MAHRLLSLYGNTFNPLWYSPALWLDASDPSTLIMDGARTFTAASSQYLSITDAASSQILRGGSSDFAGSFWCNLTTLQSFPVFIAKQSGINAKMEYRCLYEPTNKKFYWEIGDGLASSASIASVSSTVSATVGAWFHVMGWKTGGKVYISVNGETPVEATISGTPGVNDGQFTLGYGPGITYLNGKMDSVCFFKPTAGWLASNATALRDYLYNGGSGRRSSDFMASSYYTGGNPSGAVSWWDMDARSGDETDRIGSNNLTDNGGVGYAAGVASGLVQYTGDPVKQWSDKSGNARHVTAASDPVRPAYATGVSNGLPAVLFDAIDDKLDLGSALSLTDQTIFAVVKFANTVTAATVRKDIFNNSTDTVGLVFGVTSGFFTNERLTWFRQTGTIYGKSQSGADIPAGAYVYGLRYTNATPLTEIWQNGLAQTLTNSTNGEANSSRPYSGYQRIGRVFGDHICELIILPSAITAAEVAKFHRYLGSKWGISVP